MGKMYEGTKFADQLSIGGRYKEIKQKEEKPAYTTKKILLKQ